MVPSVSGLRGYSSPGVSSELSASMGISLIYSSRCRGDWLIRVYVIKAQSMGRIDCDFQSLAAICLGPSATALELAAMILNLHGICLIRRSTAGRRQAKDHQVNI